MSPGPPLTRTTEYPVAQAVCHSTRPIRPGNKHIRYFFKLAFTYAAAAAKEPPGPRRDETLTMHCWRRAQAVRRGRP